jgi:hypothetical protein
LFQALIGPLANLAGTWFENKVEKTKAEGQAKIAEARARATVAEKVAAGEVAWEGKNMLKKVLIYWQLYQSGISIFYTLQLVQVLESRELGKLQRCSRKNNGRS